MWFSRVKNIFFTPIRKKPGLLFGATFDLCLDTLLDAHTRRLTRGSRDPMGGRIDARP
ncbi:hypothetical protein DF3PB_570005 [uncultured Defluviicoccus sp.]|uniref:Uncharacterized protein n=1 Tax=metagenome TaxID=256318 RepID=A0A380TK52_9ZZZZ|nr:hypothetical protein DF3PB_570005 [uncultured Defluviicoccus sp.]